MFSLMFPHHHACHVSEAAATPVHGKRLIGDFGCDLKRMAVCVTSVGEKPRGHLSLRQGVGRCSVGDKHAYLVITAPK
jgi:hypothetical protein